MGKVRLLFTSDGAPLGERIALGLEAQGWPLAFGLFDDGDLDPRPVAATLVIWTPQSRSSPDILLACDNAMAERSLVPIGLAGHSPSGFESVPPIDLGGWSGDESDPRWRFVLDELVLAQKCAAKASGGASGGEPGGSSAGGRDEVPHAMGDVARAPDERTVDLGGVQGAAGVAVGRPDSPAAAAGAAFAAAGQGAVRPSGANRAPSLVENSLEIETPRPEALAVRGIGRAISRRPNLAAVSAGFAAALCVMGGAAFVAGLATYQSGPANAAAPPSPASMRTIAAAEDPPPVISFVVPADDAFDILADTTPGSLAPLATDAVSPKAAMPDSSVPEMAAGATAGQLDQPPPAGEGDASDPDSAEPGASEPDGLAGNPPADDDFIGRLAWATSADNPDEAIRKAVGPEAVAAAAAAELIIAEASPGDMDAALAQADAARAGVAAGFRDCAFCPLMTPVSAGRFALGSPAGQAARSLDEYVRTDVTIERPFAIGAYEVTFAQWDACVADGGCRGYEPSDLGWGRGQRPVVNVSFEDATAFAEWLSRKTGHAYRLPSEAEWEYAARADAPGPFAFGEGLSTRLANYHGAYPYDGPKGVYRKQTLPVGAFEANGFGLYDVHGNVWEWTADCWKRGALVEAPGQSPVNAAEGGDCRKRVVKGGAWNSGGWRLRAAHRQPTPATGRNYATGFRVVREM